MPQPRHVATHAAMMKFLDKKDPKQREAEQMEVPEKVSQLKLIALKLKPRDHPGQIENYLINIEGPETPVLHFLLSWSVLLPTCPRSQPGSRSLGALRLAI